MSHDREPLALLTIGEVTSIDTLLRDLSAELHSMVASQLTGIARPGAHPHRKWHELAQRCDAARRALELEPLAKRVTEAAQQRARASDVPYAFGDPCPRCDVCGDMNPGLSVREADGSLRKRCNVLGCAGHVS